MADEDYAATPADDTAAALGITPRLSGSNGTYPALFR
jgi:hypothetical protein